MATIDITHQHSLPMKKAREAVEELAQKLSERFDMDYGWDGDSMAFNRSGVDGRIDLGEDNLRVTAKLGFLLSALQGTVEGEIRRVLDEKFP